MLQDIKKLLERNSLLIAIVATIILAVLSLSAVPKINMGLGIKSADKYLHFIAYFGLTILWYFALKDRIHEKVFKFFVPLALILYGIILEGLQSGLTTYRTGDIYDALANTAGVMVALLVFKRLLKWYRTI
ncbi:VanZ family protein [Lutimonas sp.]|uniref:VanZ family protein n=1 Tax=Lutimonas sp. TaxID=1872403 RepID=UPI003D9B030E